MRFLGVMALDVIGLDDDDDEAMAGNADKLDEGRSCRVVVACCVGGVVFSADVTAAECSTGGLMCLAVCAIIASTRLASFTAFADEDRSTFTVSPPTVGASLD